MELDLIDKKIIRSLDRDARAPYSKIGRQNHLSKETVQYRIKSLMKRGVITGFYAIVDFTKMGFLPLRLYIRLKSMAPAQEKEFIIYLSSIRIAWKIYRTNGPYHLALGLLARDMWEFEQAWDAIQTRFGPHIQQTHLCTMTEYAEYTHDYIYGGEDKVCFRVFSKSETVDVDELDMQILSILSADARIPMLDLARKLRVSPITVRRRFQRMMKKQLIVGFRPLLDVEKLGYEYYKVDMSISDYSKREPITRHILSLPQVTNSEKTIITSDIEFDLEVRDFHHFSQIMEGIRNRFRGEIVDYSYYSRLQEYQTDYMPSIRRAARKE